MANNAISSMPDDDSHATFAMQFAVAQHRVFGYIATLVPSRDDAEDVFQETCVILWSKWAQWDTHSEFVSWACAIAHNVVLNFRRSERRATRAVTLPDEILDQLAALRIGSESLLEARGRALAACLAKLSARQRELIERCYLQGNAIQAVAERMAITSEALYVRLYRIRRALHECIDRTIARELGLGSGGGA